jgi:hypothetical protein
MRKMLSMLDLGISNFRYVMAFTTIIVVTTGLLSPFTISVDGFSYLKSSEVLFGPDFVTYYTWLREPGYPLFLRLVEDTGGLFLVVMIQGLFVAFGVLATIYATYRLLEIRQVSWRTFLASALAVALVVGYASTILQQAVFIALFGWLLLVISRIVVKRQFDKATGALIFVLLLSATATAVFMGLAFGMTLFVTILISRVFGPKLLVSYSLIGAIAFASVMVPWSQIKSANAPVGSYDAVSMAAFNTENTLSNFNLDKEFHEAFQTQAALLNLGGEFPPISGLGIANENRIFGTPDYSPENACGRFLTGVDPDWLWGKIETTYRDRCVPQTTLSIISSVNSISKFFFPLTGLALLVTFILSLGYRPHLRPIVLPAFLITLPYLVMDGSISRYGVLTVPLGAILLVELLKPKVLLKDPTN